MYGGSNPPGTSKEFQKELLFLLYVVGLTVAMIVRQGRHAGLPLRMKKCGSCSLKPYCEAVLTFIERVFNFEIIAVRY